MKQHRMHPYNMPHRPRAPEQEQRIPEQEDAPDLSAPEMNEEPISFENAEPASEATVEQEAEEGNAAAGRDLDAELNEERLRMAAEMDNFKKRLSREHQEQMKYASENRQAIPKLGSFPAE